MPANRPNLPAQLRRDLLVEAGHRCAIPVCQNHPVEFAHIVPRRDVQVDEFPNMIALCPTCHTRYDRGEIDRKAMLQYKANLGVINGRYGDTERRLLDYLALERHLRLLTIEENERREADGTNLEEDARLQADLLAQGIAPGTVEIMFGQRDLLQIPQPPAVHLPGGMTFIVMNLVFDRLIEPVPDPLPDLERLDRMYVNGHRLIQSWRLTQAGEDFVDRWLTARSLAG